MNFAYALEAAGKLSFRPGTKISTAEATGKLAAALEVCV